MPVSSLKAVRATCTHAGRGVALKSSSSQQTSRVSVNGKGETKEWCGCQGRDMISGSINRNPVPSGIFTQQYAAKSPESLFPCAQLYPPSLIAFQAGERRAGGGDWAPRFQKHCPVYRPLSFKNWPRPKERAISRSSMWKTTLWNF